MGDHPTPCGNVIEFPTPPNPPTVRDILEALEGDPRSPSRIAWELVRDIDCRDGGDILALALAIGWLCRANAGRGGPG